MKTLIQKPTSELIFIYKLIIFQNVLQLYFRHNVAYASKEITTVEFH